MQHLPRMRFALRLLLILMGLIGVAASGYLLLYWCAYRQAMHNEMSYSAEQRRLYADAERRLRNEIDAFQRATEGDRTALGMTNRLFEMLRYSAIAANSREVEHWAKQPESPERQAVALKWAKAAADEAAFMSELHRRWVLDYERGVPPHHITNDEVKPFAMPEGWTSDDYKWGH